MSVAIEEKPIMLPGAMPLTGASKKEAVIENNIEQLEEDGRRILLEADLSASKGSRDEAVISKENLPEQAEQKGVQRQENWQLTDHPLWRLLLLWEPQLQGMAMLDDMLKQLLEMYEALLLALMTNTSGPVRQEQKLLLDSALSSALNRLWDTCMADLARFFADFGRPEQVTQIKRELYRAVTGQRLGERESEHFWNMGRKEAAPQVNSQNQTGKSTPLAAEAGRAGWKEYSIQEKQSLIYQPGNKMTVKTTVIPDEPALRAASVPESNKKVLIRSAAGQPAAGLLVDAARKGDGVPSSITVGDIKLSNRFASYLHSENNLLASPEIAAGGEEVKGVLTSILQIQSRELAKTGNMGRTMSRFLFEGVERYIDSYIRRTEAAVNSQSRMNGEIATFQYKNVYKVNSQMMNLYQKYDQAEKAVPEGIRYAVELSRERKHDKADSDKSDYRFFEIRKELPRGEQLFWADLKAAKFLLERNWCDFWLCMGFTSGAFRKPICLIPLEQGFWGINIEPDKQEISELYKKYFYLLLSLMGFGLLVLLMLRFS